MRALVSDDEVVAVVEEHLDRLYCAALRLGCSPAQAGDVARDAAITLVADLVTRPETVGDLVGGLYARLRTAAARAARADPASPPADDLTEVALRLLPERRRLGLLLVDLYAVDHQQTAVALDLDVAETARTVALGRVALVRTLDGDEPPSLDGHDVAIGDLGQLADGSAPAGGRFAALRQRVSGCATCAGNLGVQSRGAGVVGDLPVTTLAAGPRGQVLGAVRRRAAESLPSAEEVAAELSGGAGRPPLLPRWVLLSALVVAVVLGVLLGVLLG